jgi:hypothetical protein
LQVTGKILPGLANQIVEWAGMIRVTIFQTEHTGGQTVIAIDHLDYCHQEYSPVFIR